MLWRCTYFFRQMTEFTGLARLKSGFFGENTEKETEPG